MIIRILRPAAATTKAAAAAAATPRSISTVARSASALRQQRLFSPLLFSQPCRQSSRQSSRHHHYYSTAPPADPPRTPWIRPSTVLLLLLGGVSALPLHWLFATMETQPPAAGTPEAAALERRLAAEGSKLAVVQMLEADPAWETWELGGKWTDGGEDNGDEDIIVDDVVVVDDKGAEMAEATTQTPRRLRLTRDALGGPGGLGGYQRIFHNAETGEIISVVWLGMALSGWPGMVHGGAMATLLDEALGRCAIHALPARTGVTARLELRFRKTAPAPSFYIVHVTPELPPDHQDRKTIRKLWCAATLSVVGAPKPVAEARALFVVPRGYKLGRVEDRF